MNNTSNAERTQKRVIIAGAGPSGLLLARELAKAKWDVTVFEAKQKEDFRKTHNWSDAVEHSVLAEVGLPIPHLEGNRFSGDGVKPKHDSEGLYEPHYITDLKVFSPDYKVKIKDQVRFPMILTDRVGLTYFQLKQAEEAGAKVSFGSKIIALTGKLDGGLEDISVTGCTVQDGDTTKTFETDLVVDAAGLGAVLRGMLGEPEISKQFEKDDIADVFRTVCSYDKLKTDIIPTVDHYCYGKLSGYFWTHYHRDGEIDVGGGATNNPSDTARNVVLDMAKSIEVGEEIRGGGGRTLVGASPLALVANGFAALGDSAGMTNPMNGCGVAPGMRGALILADVLRKAEDCSIKSLWSYAHRWFTGIGAHCAALCAMCKALQSLTHDDISFMYEREILDSTMMYNNMTVCFAPPGIGASIRTLFACLGSNMKLLGILMDAQSRAKKLYKICKEYPKSYDKTTYKEFCEKYNSKS